MPNKTSPSSMQAEVAANLIFTLFIHVSDVEESLTAREVLCLQEMIDHSSWCEDAVLKVGLDNLRERYMEMWKAYQKDPLLRELPNISKWLNELLARVADQNAILAALQRFLELYKRNSSPMLVRIGLASLPTAKLNAFRAGQAALIQPKSKPGSVPAGAGTNSEGMSTSVTSMPKRAPVSVTVPDGLSIWPAALLTLDSENQWGQGRIRVRCVAVIPETTDVKTYVFHAVNPVLFAYKPGQFVTLELPIDGKTIRRSYTISSSPSRPYTLSITVKLVRGGLASHWLHENMHVGFELHLTGPYGDFTCFDAPAKKLLLIAAGSGVTPVMSMLRWLVDTSSNADIVFINNIRTPADFIFEQELRNLGMLCSDRLKIGIIPSKLEAGQWWHGPVCRFSEDVIRMWAPDFVERETFVCGPSAYMDMVYQTLERMGLPMQRYHQESFGIVDPAEQIEADIAPVPDFAAFPQDDLLAAAPTRVLAKDNSAAIKVELVFAVSAKTVMATSDDYILDIAEQHGIKLGSSCRGGNCGSCKLKKIEGVVEMDEQYALTQDDIDDGFILACRSRASGHRVILDA